MDCVPVNISATWNIPYSQVLAHAKKIDPTILQQGMRIIDVETLLSELSGKKYVFIFISKTPPFNSFVTVLLAKDKNLHLIYKNEKGIYIDINDRLNEPFKVIGYYQEKKSLCQRIQDAINRNL